MPANIKAIYYYHSLLSANLVIIYNELNLHGIKTHRLQRSFYI